MTITWGELERVVEAASALFGIPCRFFGGSERGDDADGCTAPWLGPTRIDRRWMDGIIQQHARSLF
jgi:hypothetical protein